jgi:anti-sigma-K factor RskA
MSDDDDNIEMDDENVLAAEYTLGLLSAEESQAFEELLSIDPGFRQRYAFWAEGFAGLTDDIAPVEPPADLKDRILAELFPDKTLSRADPLATADSEPRPSFLQRLGLFPAVAGGLLAALVVLGVVDLMIDDAPTPATYVAEVAAEDQSLVVMASYAADRATLTVDRQAGAAAAGRSLELWLIPPGDGQAPISLGVLPQETAAAIQILADLVPSLDQGTLAISDEPEGGSPGDAPTGDILATGAITAA